MSRAINPVDGTAVAYAAVGPADAPALLLAHGSALSSAIWRGFGYMAALRQRYRLLLPDLRGHGRSDKPTDPDCYAMDLVVGDLLAVLDDAGVERAHVMGYSFGARSVLSLAVAAEDRVRSLIVGGGSARPQAGAFDRLFFPGCVDVLERDGMEAFLDAWSAHRQWPVDAATRAAFRANDDRALAAYFRRSEQEPGIADEALTALRVPTLAFVGSEDLLRVPDTRALARTIPGARLAVLRGFDHATTIAASREVLSVVEPFLAAAPRA
ncbi:alpha/beta hydrolase [Rhodococcus sp. HM1]|uniref:alpha/beta fold hydrolase n=1 Tax=unclassified Rhodococcus (in: high G+C Gram-positive bacteria) TaxID=192944 RepID=UPI0018CD23C4|nr:MULTISPECIES: alpha/beta fold hydrolase [unclassified Rhodococcus (in: high G+C Gram-positive bacteria)]MBH0121471.1 alpha/beta fold hydrolase [Rhodococcus sp. CX]MCK8673667.1 alpha/beta hydrolase [Rhodococcus sp. HM1]